MGSPRNRPSRTRCRSTPRHSFERLEERIALSAAPPSVEEPIYSGGFVQAPLADGASTAAWVQSLTYLQFNLLLPEHVQYLTLSQVASIPDVYWLGQIPDASRAMLNAAQVQSLNVASTRITFLTPQQVGFLTTAQIQSLGVHDFRYLGPTQTPQLTPSQVGLIPDEGTFWLWPPEARAALTAPQVQRLNVGVIKLNLLTTTQIGYLSTSQIQSLTAMSDLAKLSPTQIPQLTTSQIASIPDENSLFSLPTASRAALTAAQIPSLNVGATRINWLTAQQVGWLSTNQIRALTNFNDFKLLNASQTPLLTTVQIGWIPDEAAFWAWTAAARAALTSSQVQALHVATVRLTLLTPSQIASLTTTQIQSLTNHDDFWRLGSDQVDSLTPAQVSAIPDDSSFARWTEGARFALTQSQIPFLNVATVRIYLLSPQEVSWLVTDQIRALTNFNDFRLLSGVQTPSLTPSQMSLIPNEAALWAWTPAARAALTSPQIQALDVAEIHLTLLTPAQIGWLSTTQVRSLTSIADIAKLSPTQIPLLTSAQVASIPDDDALYSIPELSRFALTATQIPSLNVAATRIFLLSSQQIGWLTAGQVAALTDFNDFARLPASHVPSLTAAQLALVPTEAAFAAWPVASRAALTAAQVQSLDVATLRLTHLTPSQIGWLTTTQVRSLDHANDFPRLSPAQASLLTASQLALVNSYDAFYSWPVGNRAALTQSQVNSLNIAQTRISLLTTTQIDWLTAAQIQAINVVSDFRFLTPAKAPQLSLGQIALILDMGGFLAWTPEARAALNQAQVRTLNVQALRVVGLTNQQIAWLTTSQLQSLSNLDFRYLSPDQIPLLSPQQFATTTFEIIANLSDASRAELTRNQLLNMPLTELALVASLRIPQFPPTNYLPVVTTPTAADGLSGATHILAEAQRAYDLVPLSAATHTAIASGDWSNPAVWQGGAVPGQNANVVIPTGRTVRFDAAMTTALRTLRIDGTLHFAVDRNTVMRADTIVVMTTGALHMGTVTAPIGANYTAQLLFDSTNPINSGWDPFLLSRGLISRGQVRIHGREVTSHVEIAGGVGAGAATLSLPEIPVGWRVGDELIISGTNPHLPDFGAETVVIQAINGPNVTITPLARDHRPPTGFSSLAVSVANPARNIIFRNVGEGAVSQRPHVMFLHNPDVDVRYVRIEGFGRTNKSAPINDPVVIGGVLQAGTGTNVRARYALHFHHTGVNPNRAPAHVEGVFVEGSPGWGVVNHSSNVDVVESVVFGAVGAAFVSEDGNEIGSMVGNLAMNSTGSGDPVDDREAIHDFGHSGHGYWFQGPGIIVRDNIAAGTRHSGFNYFTASSKDLFDTVNVWDPALSGGQTAIPVGSLPIREFTGNVAYAVGSGLEIWFNQAGLNDHPSLIDEFTAWGVRTNGFDVHYSGQIHIRNALMLGDLQTYGASAALRTNVRSHDIDVENSDFQGFEAGVIVTTRGTTTIRGGRIAAVRGIVIPTAYDTIRTLDVRTGLNMPKLTASQLAGRQQLFFASQPYVNFEYMSPSAVFGEDRLYITVNGTPLFKIYLPEQQANYVPFPSGSSNYETPYEYLDLTNQQLKSAYGYSLGGEITPADAFQPNGYGVKLKLVGFRPAARSV